MFYLGIGNTSPAAEFNFGKDPEAAQICVSSLKNITLVTWELCTAAKMPWVSRNVALPPLRCRSIET